MDIGIPLRLAHLPLVMDVYRRCGLADTIDNAIGQDPRSAVSTAECVGVILCGVYGGAHGLWRLRERLAHFDMPTIMQDRHFDLQRFPEERLAKALDDLFDFSLDKLMTGVALEAIRQFRLDTSWLHFDTTSLSFYGAHEQPEPPFGVTPETPPPRVTFGHSKSNRPDLRQLLFGALVTSDGGVPLWGKALDGNLSDSEAAAEFFTHIRSLVEDPRKVTCVADSKGWCARVLDVVRHENLRLLSRLPRSHRLHRELMAKRWMHVEKWERPIRPGKEAEYYEYMGWDVEEQLVWTTTGADGKPQHETLTIPARAVRVFSSALLRTKMATRDRMHVREKRQATKQIRDWQDVVYACEDDAERGADRHVRQSDFATLDLQATIVRQVGPAKRGRGRPRRRPEPPLAAKEHWRVRYTVRKVTARVTERRLHDAATFIMIRTRNDDWEITDREMIQRYKDQYHVEHGFAWLKNGAAINPMFIETPKRMASMCFVYCLGLMVYNLIQRTVRKYLKEHQTGLPYHRNKPSDRITTQFLFELFPKVQTVPITMPDGRQESRLVGFESIQQLAATALGSEKSAFSPVILAKPN